MRKNTPLSCHHMFVWLATCQSVCNCHPQTVHHASYLPSVHKKPWIQGAENENGPFFCPKKRSRRVFQPSFFSGFCCWFQRGCSEGPISYFTTQTHKTHTINLHLVTPQSPPSPLPSLESLEDSHSLWAYKRTPNQNE